MLVEICQRQLLHMRKRLLAHVARHAEAHAVIERLHRPLAHRRGCRHNGDCRAARRYGGKIHLSGCDDAVDGIAHQNGNIQAGRNEHGCKQDRARHIRAVGPQQPQYAAKRSGRFFHASCSFLFCDA